MSQLREDSGSIAGVIDGYPSGTYPQIVCTPEEVDAGQRHNRLICDYTFGRKETDKAYNINKSLCNDTGRIGNVESKIAYEYTEYVEHIIGYY